MTQGGVRVWKDRYQYSMLGLKELLEGGSWGDDTLERMNRVVSNLPTKVLDKPITIITKTTEEGINQTDSRHAHATGTI